MRKLCVFYIRNNDQVCILMQTRVSTQPTAPSCYIGYWSISYKKASTRAMLPQPIWLTTVPKL